jgi:hypothetical protein
VTYSVTGIRQNISLQGGPHDELQPLKFVNGLLGIITGHSLILRRIFAIPEGFQEFSKGQDGYILQISSAWAEAQAEITFQLLFFSQGPEGFQIMGGDIFFCLNLYRRMICQDFFWPFVNSFRTFIGVPSNEVHTTVEVLKQQRVSSPKKRFEK